MSIADDTRTSGVRDAIARALAHIDAMHTALYPEEHAYVAAKHLRLALDLIERTTEERP